MIRPLDMQVNIVKTHEVSRVEHNQHQKGTNEQMQFSSEMEKHITKQRENVVQTEKTDKNNVDPDGRKSQDRKGKKGKKDEKSKADQEAVKTVTGSTSMFDVKI